MRELLSSGVKFIMSRLNSFGRRADIVGGAVRDYLLGKAPYDFDITTDATPTEMREIFSDLKTLDIGIKHGTLTVIYEGEPYEITTYRVEREYIDHRHPTSVSFTRSLYDDLSRRDFTMNAICYNELDGFTDAFSGIRDIENKIIRAVGDPYLRFDEDALRIMRALRFSATLGFRIEEKTRSAIFDKAHLLSFISRERILSEWKKLIVGDYAYDVILEFSPIISDILSLDAPVGLIEREAFNSLSGGERVLSIFLFSQKSPYDSFLLYADKLGLDNEGKREGEALLLSPIISLPTDTDIRTSFSKIGVEYTEKKLRLYSAHGVFDYSSISERIEPLSRMPYSLSHLAVSGTDIMSEGILGKRVGEILSLLLTLVIKGEIANEKDELIEYIKSHG